MKVNSGQDKQALALAGGTQAGYTGTATATTATSLTATGTPWGVNAWAGKIVVATGNVYGVVISNTSSVLTIDRWYNPVTPTGTAATPPSGTAVFLILGGAAPVFYMALTTTGAFTPVATDTTLSAEYAVAGGGLSRQAATYAHTTGANTYTLTGTYTVNGTDTGLPRTITGIGTFDTATSSTGVMLHETALSATATLSAIGDQLTVTQTVTM